LGFYLAVVVRMVIWQWGLTKVHDVSSFSGRSRPLQSTPIKYGKINRYACFNYGRFRCGPTKELLVFSALGPIDLPSENMLHVAETCDAINSYVGCVFLQHSPVRPQGTSQLSSLLKPQVNSRVNSLASEAPSGIPINLPITSF
jgi:hypothetical protein